MEGSGITVSNSVGDMEIRGGLVISGSLVFQAHLSCEHFLRYTVVIRKIWLAFNASSVACGRPALAIAIIITRG